MASNLLRCPVRMPTRKKSAGAEIRFLGLCTRPYIQATQAVNCANCLRLLRNGSWLKQVGKIRRIGCITEIRPDVKNVL